ncbi:MAG: iron-containing alcohol dehydrogenase [Pseudomonadota bacterium]
MQPFPPFTLTPLPRILFGEGRLAELPAETARLGRRALLVTGARSFRDSRHWRPLVDGLAAAGVAVETLAVAGEPTPDLVDGAVAEFKGRGIEVVVAVGGGSTLDAAKAIAGLLPSGASVMDHLEYVGRGVPYAGPALPLVAVPTTAGTGAEATKNAVISRVGADGFKRSFRDERLMPALALVDPALLEGCPRDVLAANGMDAFTQLLESFVSTRANAMTDALAWSGLEAFRDGFFPALEGTGDEAAKGRARLAYAALVSGICLAHTGLGAVHGLASPLGAFFPIPHGVVCGTLVGETTHANIEALLDRDPFGPAIPKYGKVGGMLSGHARVCGGDGLIMLTDVLDAWTERLELPRLAAFGVTVDDFPRIVAASGGNSMKTNPIVLEPAEIENVLRRRL